MMLQRLVGEIALLGFFKYGILCAVCNFRRNKNHDPIPPITEYLESVPQICRH